MTFPVTCQSPSTLIGKIATVWRWGQSPGRRKKKGFIRRKDPFFPQNRFGIFSIVISGDPVLQPWHTSWIVIEDLAVVMENTEKRLHGPVLRLHSVQGRSGESLHGMLCVHEAGEDRRKK